KRPSWAKLTSGGGIVKAEPDAAALHRATMEPVMDVGQALKVLQTGELLGIAEKRRNVGKALRRDELGSSERVHGHLLEELQPVRGKGRTTAGANYSAPDPQ